VDASDGDYTSMVLVNWDAVPEAEYYTVYRGDSSAGYNETWSPITATHYNDTEAVIGKKHWYWVRAVSTIPLENSADGQDTGYRNFTPPTGVSASDGIYTALVSVNWNAVAGATRYQVFRDGVKVGIAGAGTFSDYGAVLGMLHLYRVKACNSDESICSGLSAGDNGCRRLYAPTHLSATDGTYADKVRLTWNASEGAGAYEVMRAASQGGAQTEIGTPETTTFDDTTGAAGVTYFYWVKACSFIGCSDLSGYDTGYRANPTPTRTPTRTRTRTPTPTATYTLRPTNTPGPSPTWVPGAAPRMFLPILMK
jgi:fibronectin type 3 domain-containing protein